MADASKPKDACTIRKGPFWTCVSIVVYTLAAVIFAIGALGIIGPAFERGATGAVPAEEPHWLVRVVEVYSNESEELVAEHRLPPVPLAELQQRWSQPETEPMLDMFPVSASQVPFLSQLLGVSFDLERFAYFLTAYTTEPEKSQRFMGQYPAPRDLPAFPGTRRVMPKTPAD